MDALETYAKANLSDEISIIENTNRKNEYPQLTTYEKAVIYKYSDDGYKKVNEYLRKSKGKTFNDFANHLNNALTKLPNFEGLVYRKVYLTNDEITRYKINLKNNKPLREYPFISATKSRLIAMNFEGTTEYEPNCLFRIQTKTGKEIDKIAKFDEKEVLIKPNTTFSVLEIKKELNYTLITLEET
jgi:hypothetical protein